MVTLMPVIKLDCSEHKQVTKLYEGVYAFQ